ncbi:hypothetical protein CLAFUW4_09100 [Fulvia fulva]|nr:hypothetical protein CLAFUR4_09106 [Fulvia fulva]KAK4614683.1 hypothetical protein CLAFUR0_09098 [Fulvia fulva]WPV20347.1 hypothetical protein CLAFUW4_09100 [Fulvia fulva]WPV35290.1 hypothetical protein CLAFUW7_09101 [Fulvia fulva]
MAHSLAGFILKQCVVVADAQKDRFRLLREALAGIVLMGCPHATKEARRTELYNKSNDILRLSNLGRRVKDRLQYGQELLNTCRRFDDVCNDTNILSLHEQRPTRVPVRLGSSAQYLVGKRMAKIDSGKPEVLTSIDSDHRSLPSLEDDQAPLKLDEIAFRELKRILSMSGRSSFDNAEPVMPGVVTRTPVALEPLIQAFVKPRLPNLPFFELNISRQRTKDFHGREEVLEKLDTQLLSGPNMAILYGTGGLGKSEVALEFVHRRRGRFDAIFWLKADNLSKMRQDFGRFAAQLGLEDEGGATDPFTSREMMKTWLEEPIQAPNKSGRQVATWLVVFDGADDLKVLNEFKSIYGKGAILVTTREADSVEILSADMPTDSVSASLFATKMHTFGQDEAVDLLAKLVRLNMDDEEEHQSARQIAGILNGLPLAINQMAGVINSQYLTLSEFCERYQDIDTRGLRHHGDSGRLGSQSMISSMRMALLSPQAIALLKIFVLLDPDCIHENLFDNLADADIVFTGFPATQAEFVKSRNELLQAALVQRNGARQEL